MSLPGVTLFPLNVQGYRHYLSMKYEKRNWHGQYLNSLLYLELATLLIFDFSIMTLGFICQNRISLPLLLHQLLIFIALYSLQLINTMLGYTCQQLIFFQNLPLKECMGTLVKQLHLPPHHHHQKAVFQFLLYFFFFFGLWKSRHNDRDRNIYVHTQNLFPLPEFISLQNLKKERKKLVFFIFECEKKNQYVHFLGISWTQDNIFTSICI